MDGRYRTDLFLEHGAFELDGAKENGSLTSSHPSKRFDLQFHCSWILQKAPLVLCAGQAFQTLLDVRNAYHSSFSMITLSQSLRQDVGVQKQKLIKIYALRRGPNFRLSNVLRETDEPVKELFAEKSMVLRQHKSFSFTIHV